MYVQVKQQCAQQLITFLMAHIRVVFRCKLSAASSRFCRRGKGRLQNSQRPANRWTDVSSLRKMQYFGKFRINYCEMKLSTWLCCGSKDIWQGLRNQPWNNSDVGIAKVSMWERARSESNACVQCRSGWKVVTVLLQPGPAPRGDPGATARSALRNGCNQLKGSSFFLFLDHLQCPDRTEQLRGVGVPQE